MLGLTDFQRRQLLPVFKALANDTRLEIVGILLDETMLPLARLHAQFPDLEASSFSYHLGVLEKAGLLTRKTNKGVVTCFMGNTAEQVARRLVGSHSGTSLSLG